MAMRSHRVVLLIAFQITKKSICYNQPSAKKNAANDIGEPMDAGNESSDHHKGSKDFYGTGNYASQIAIFNTII